MQRCQEGFERPAWYTVWPRWKKKPASSMRNTSLSSRMPMWDMPFYE
jgi:hypothetical protein